MALPSGKIYLSFKTMENIKISDPLLPMNSFYDQDDILQKKSYDTTQKVRFGGISL